MGQPKNRGIIGILTGGGDVPGLNPAIRAVTIRALREGYKVIGIKRGWGGLIDIVRDPQYDNSGNFFELTGNREQSRTHRWYFPAYIQNQGFPCT